jgi:hypothetical protein
MKKFMLVGAILALGSVAAWAGSICPAGSGSNPFTHNPDGAATGCNVVITINSNGSVSVVVTDPTPYENSEDVLVGVLNSSGTAVSSLNLTGSSIFGFDGDGICTFTFVGSSYCTASQKAGTDPGDYAGPTSTFTNIGNGGNSGTVLFSPAIAAGGTTYFSLEGTPSASLVATVGSSSPAGVPALSPWGMALLVTMLVGLSFWMMKKQTA